MRNDKGRATKASRRKSKTVTIRDVARHAGVSHMTVSRVLNAEGNVAEETLQRVNVSIKALRYAPSQIARSLATSDMVRVGLLYANSTSAYFNDLLLGSLEQSSLSGCQLMPGKCEDFRSVTKAVQH